MKKPLDRTNYARDPRSEPISPAIKDGLYVYVQDARGVVFVAPDGPHMHPRVLGRAAAAKYAGDLVVRGGVVIDLTNLSGTFRFRHKNGLLNVALAIESAGLTIALNAVRFFPSNGCRPVVLR